MNKVLIIGSLNMDTVISMNKIPTIGETVIANNRENFCGGKGSNQAIACHRLGGEVRMLGKVGDDKYGQILLTKFKDSNVDSKFILIDKSSLTGEAFINIDKDGKNTIIVYPGANFNLFKEDIVKSKEVFEDISYCIVQYEIPIPTVEFIIEHCWELGIKVVVNPSPVAYIKEELYKMIDIIIVNETELSQLTNNDVDTEKQINNAMSKLRDMGVKNVIATFGHKGSMWINECGVISKFEAYKVDVVDTTAAGDTFTGALIASLCNGKSYSEAISYANAAGALAVSKLGAQVAIPYKKEVLEFLGEKCLQHSM